MKSTEQRHSGSEIEAADDTLAGAKKSRLRFVWNFGVDRVRARLILIPRFL